MGHKCSKRIVEKNLRGLYENHSEMSKRIEIKAVNVNVQREKIIINWKQVKTTKTYGVSVEMLK